jgi:hypothetical protein
LQTVGVFGKFFSVLAEEVAQAVEVLLIHGSAQLTEEEVLAIDALVRGGVRMRVHRTGDGGVQRLLRHDGDTVGGAFERRGMRGGICESERRGDGDGGEWRGGGKVALARGKAGEARREKDAEQSDEEAGEPRGAERDGATGRGHGFVTVQVIFCSERAQAVAWQ